MVGRGCDTPERKKGGGPFFWKRNQTEKTEPAPERKGKLTAAVAKGGGRSVAFKIHCRGKNRLGPRQMQKKKKEAKAFFLLGGE